MAFVTLVVARWLEWELAQWVHPMKDRSDNPSHHERTFLPQSYISLPFQVQAHCPVTWNSIQNSGELAERAKQYITVDYYWLMRCSSMVECPLLVPWVVWSILHGELFFFFFFFLVATRTPWPNEWMFVVCAIPPVGWCTSKRFLAVKWKE